MYPAAYAADMCSGFTAVRFPPYYQSDAATAASGLAHLMLINHQHDHIPPKTKRGCSIK